MPCREINGLELEFLFSINFSLHVTVRSCRVYGVCLRDVPACATAFGAQDEVYGKYARELENHMISPALCECSASACAMCL